MVDLVDITKHIPDHDATLSQDVAECLRKWLALAESGQLVGVAIAGESADGETLRGWTVLADGRPQIIGQLEILKLELAKGSEIG